MNGREEESEMRREKDTAQSKIKKSRGNQEKFWKEIKVQDTH